MTKNFAWYNMKKLDKSKLAHHLPYLFFLNILPSILIEIYYHLRFPFKYLLNVRRVTRNVTHLIQSPIYK